MANVGGDRLYGAVDVFLKRDDISEESKRKLLVDNTARFYGLEKLETCYWAKVKRAGVKGTTGLACNARLRQMSWRQEHCLIARPDPLIFLFRLPIACCLM